MDSESGLPNRRTRNLFITVGAARSMGFEWLRFKYILTWWSAITIVFVHFAGVALAGPPRDRALFFSSWTNTELNNRLSKLDFVDGLTGWAVGDFGTILFTRDGGNTWQAQHSGTESNLTAFYFF
jgi:hypothetical protein